MTEIDQLKKRIDQSGSEEIPTAHIHDDYEPAGDLMMRQLMAYGEYVQRRNPDWRIYHNDHGPSIILGD